MFPSLHICMFVSLHSIMFPLRSRVSYREGALGSPPPPWGFIQRGSPGSPGSPGISPPHCMFVSIMFPSLHICNHCMFVSLHSIMFPSLHICMFVSLHSIMFPLRSRVSYREGALGSPPPWGFIQRGSPGNPGSPGISPPPMGFHTERGPWDSPPPPPPNLEKLCLYLP